MQHPLIQKKKNQKKIVVKKYSSYLIAFVCLLYTGNLCYTHAVNFSLYQVLLESIKEYERHFKVYTIELLRVEYAEKFMLRSRCERVEGYRDQYIYIFQRSKPCVVIL